MHLYLYNADKSREPKIWSLLFVTINQILCQFFEFTQNLKRSHMNGRFVAIFVDIAFAIVLSLFLFIFAPITEDGFIAAYVFLMIAVFMQIIPVFLSRNKQNIVYQSTYFAISIAYLLFQIVVSFGTIFWFLHATWKSVCLSIMLLFLYGIIMILFNFMFETGQQNEMYQKKKRQFVDLVLKCIKVCKNNTSDKELLTLCDQVIDRIRYANVMSGQDLVDVENQIISSSNLLEQLSAEHKYNECKEECYRLLALFEERNIKVNATR